MRTIHRAVVATIATTALLGSTAAAAHATTDTIKDKASDVVRYDTTGPDAGVVLGYADSFASGTDLRSLRAKHTDRSVSITLRFARLGRDTRATVPLRLDGKKRPQRFLITTGRHKGEIVDSESKKLCSVPITTTLGASGSIHAVIKRSCLDDPDKVKVAAFATIATVQGDDVTILQDVVSRSSTRNESWTTWLKPS